MVPLKTQSMVPPVQFHMVLQHYADKAICALCDK
jgi:hypothetical protein